MNNTGSIEYSLHNTFGKFSMHFYQALNETEHLEEMELREGNKYWIDRFFAKHLVLLYYWIMWVTN